jgi:hypothetical protein
VASVVGDAIFPLYTRAFSPFKNRLDSIISRLKESCNTYKQAQDTVRRPVALWAKIAEESCRRLPMFLGDILKYAKRRGRGGQAAELSRAIKDISAINREHIGWLKGAYSSAKDSFIIGKQNLAKLLDLREIGMGIDEIYSLAKGTLETERKELAGIVSRMGRRATVEKINGRINRDCPKSFHAVLNLYKKEVADVKSFIAKMGLLSTTRSAPLVISKTPQYERHVIPYAAYYPPSKFDRCRQGVYVITPPADSKGLYRHNFTLIPCTTIHEAYPGHHLQASCANTNKSIIRALFDAEEFTEGWAFYCEERMLELGYKDTLQRRFIITTDKIWRAARAIIDIDMQTGKMSFEEAVDFLRRETSMDKHVCESEVKWYTKAPGEPLSYLVGKHQILQLKEKVKSIAEKPFDERLFHDTLLYSGSMPLKYYLPVFERKLGTAACPSGG